MPIPKPHKDEEKNAFISRCMSDDVMLGEYPDQEQRAAVCNTAWRRKDMAKTRSLKVEIFAVGKWNGMEFNKEDLSLMALAFSALKDRHQVPLKFGHNDEQAMTDGQPALGWVDSVFVENDKLIAEFTDIPEAVYSAMESKLYRNVSIELDMGVEHKGDYYPFVLSGVALLGADIPAVNVLADLQAYMSKQTPLKFSKKLTFSAIKGDSEMNELEKANAEIARLKADNEAKDSTIKTVTTEKVEFERKNTEFETKETKRVEDEAKAKFSTAKQKVTDNLNDLVKAEKITPAMRDNFITQLTDDAGLEKVEFAVNAFGEIEGGSNMSNGQQGQSNSDAASSEDELITSINKVMLDRNVDFSTARNLVFKANPDAARAYVDQNGTKE